MREQIKAGLKPMTLVKPEEAKRQKITELEHQIRELIRLLREFSQHKNYCGVRKGLDRCDCGFQTRVLPHLEQ